MRLLSAVALALIAGTVFAVDVLDLRSYRDETYAVKATLGTPEKDKPNQEFYLAVDALGSETKVAGVDCWQCCDKTRYDASLSTKSSCTALPDGTDGTKTQSCTDTFQAGPVNDPKASFTDVTSTAPGSAFVSLPSDGIIGLAGAVHGFYFARTCSNDVAKGGSITVGDFDAANCDTTAAKLTTLPLAVSTDALKVLGSSVSSYKVGADADVPPTAPATWFATFTTSSPNITIPKDQFDTLNARFWKANADNTFDCKNLPPATDIKLTFPAQAVAPGTAAPAPPTLTFNIQQLAFQTDDGKCALRLQAQQDPAKPNYWEFGLPLFRTYCSKVDVKDATKASIQFAPPKVAPNAVCTYSKLTALPACNAPATTSTTESTSTISPNVTQPVQTTTPKGASRVQVMSVLSVFVMFALSVLF